MNDPQPEGHMASYIGRRKFLATLGGAAAAWPLAARAQQPGKLPTIGFLVAGTPSSHGPWVAGFVQRLRELDWIEGRTIAIEYRWAEGRSDRAAEIAAEFVRRNVDVIVTSATAVIVAAMQATSVIPIVFAAAGDPVGTGLVASLARPGRQRHRSVDPANRSCGQTTRTFARGCPRSPPVGDLGQCRRSRRRAGYARGRGNGPHARPRGHRIRNPARRRHRTRLRGAQWPCRRTLCLYRPAR